MNPMACVSFWTTFGKSVLPPFFKKEQFDEWICGCDACQDACPHNRKKDWSEGEEFPGLRELVPLLEPANLIAATDEELRERIIPKTADHVAANQTETLRRGAKRVLKYDKQNA